MESSDMAHKHMHTKKGKTKEETKSLSIEITSMARCEQRACDDINKHAHIVRLLET